MLRMVQKMALDLFISLLLQDDYYYKLYSVKSMYLKSKRTFRPKMTTQV